MIYLASPYSSPNPALEQHRFYETERFVAYHFRLSVPLFSPIVYCHTIARQYHLPGDADFWRFLNEEALLRCSKMWVLKLPGWQTSAGVKAEIAHASSLNVEIEYKEPLPNG